MSAFRALILFGVVALMAYSFVKTKPSNEEYTNSSHSPIESSVETNVSKFDEPQQPIPNSGVIASDYSDGVAPFTIRTRNDGAHFYIKIVEISSSRVIGAYFVRAGESIELQVPIGNYKLKYASGQNWYGESFLFGPDTSYSKADASFNFYDDGSQVIGYAIELFQQDDGNLLTSGISPSQF